LQTLKKLTLFLLLLIFLIHCRPGEEVLVSFEGGQIQRKHLRELYDLEDAPRNEKTMSIATQSAILEQMTIQEILEIDSQSNGFFDREDVKSMLYYTEREMVVNLYLKNFIQDKKDSEALELLDIQFALLPAEDSTKLEKAFAEVSALSSDDKIEDYLSSITIEEGRKAVGGHLEPQCSTCAAQDQILEIFKDGIQAGNSKFYIFKDGTKAFLYRVLDRKKVKTKDLESYITKKFKNLRDKAITYTNKNNSEAEKERAAYYLEDSPRLEEKSKMTAAHFIKGFQNKIIPAELLRLQTEKNIVVTEELRSGNPEFFSNKDTVLLKTPAGNYTLADLDQDFSKVFPGQKDSAGIPEKINFLQSIIVPTKLIADSPEAEKIRKSDTYKTAYSYMRRSVSFNIQKMELEKQVPEISDADLKEIYEAGKQFQYAEPNPKNPNERTPIPFPLVKEKIRQDVRSKRVEEIFKKKVADLKTKLKVQVNADKLKEGSI
jgi:hypothetical protein